MFRRIKLFSIGRLLIRTISLNCPSFVHYKNNPNIINVRRYIDKNLWRYTTIRFYADLPSHTKVPLPALSPTMDTGGLAGWSVKEGDKVNEGDPLCEIETDKASMGFDSPMSGYIAKILVPAGTKNVQLGTIICVIVEKQEDVAAFKDFKAEAPKVAAAAPVPAAAAPPPAAVAPPPVAVAPPPDAAAPPPVAVAPPPKPMAPPTAVLAPPTAPTSRGRVSLMEKGLAKAKSFRAGKKDKDGKPGIARRVVKFPEGATHVDIPATPTQLALAQRMLNSKLTIPHFVASAHCNIDKLIKFRKKVNKMLEKKKKKFEVGISDFIIKAAVTAIMAHPDFNAIWLGDRIRKYDYVDIGIACFYNGFVVPVIEKANNKGVVEIAMEIDGFEANADSLTDGPPGAMCVVNLSWIDTAAIGYIVSPNQSSVLGIGAVQHKIILNDHNERGYKESKFITCSLTGDHRVLDGALAAEWLRTFKGFVEDPITMSI